MFYHFSRFRIVTGEAGLEAQVVFLNTCVFWLSGKQSACNAGDAGLIPGLGRSPGRGNGNPLQYSCLGNPMDRGAWWATVHGVTELDIAEWLGTHTSMSWNIDLETCLFPHPHLLLRLCIICNKSPLDFQAAEEWPGAHLHALKEHVLDQKLFPKAAWWSGSGLLFRETAPSERCRKGESGEKFLWNVVPNTVTPLLLQRSVFQYPTWLVSLIQ